MRWDQMDKDELKQIILNLPENSPKLLEYLKEAKEKGWKDIIDLIQYSDYEKLLEVLTEIIRIRNIEEIKSKISRYENRIQKIKEKVEYAEKHNDQSTLKFLPKYEKMLKGLELKIKQLQEQIQNPEKVEPELLLGEIADDYDDLMKFLRIIKAPKDIRERLKYYATGQFIIDEEKLPLDICDDVEAVDEEEVDITDPYWCVKDEFEVEGYLVFLPARKSLKILLSIASDEYKELNQDVTLYIVEFKDAYSLLKTIDDYRKNYLYLSWE
jgi:flagellar biosynthesis chaperone FliJ